MKQSTFYIDFSSSSTGTAYCGGTTIITTL
jgi:hypothetical protein